MAFLEVLNISAKLVLDTFEPGNAIFLNIATHMTPVCDCFRFTGLPALPDAGVFGSDDIVALEQATLDVIARTPILEENLPAMMEIVTIRRFSLEQAPRPRFAVKRRLVPS